MNNIVKVNGYWLLVIVFLLSPLTSHLSPLYAQSDSALNRSVIVEREFQPVIQAAGKVATKPAIMETTMEATEVEYSDYTAEITPNATFHPLLSQPTRFEASKKYNGYVRGAIGHPNTLFDFGYHLNDGKNSILDVYAHHRAEWGLAALSKTKIGLNFTHTFSACDLYFGLNGGNIYYHKYGHFYDYSLVNPSAWEKNSVTYPGPYTITDNDKTALWTAEAFIGVKSNPKNDVQYMVQTGYMIFSKPGAVSEHQVRTQGGFDWSSEEHHVGANIRIQNNFLQLGSLATIIAPTQYNSRHNFRLEPYYAYEGRRVRLHAGVNFDLNIGSGQLLSATSNIAFAPSPHINLEAQIAQPWLTLYADVLGHFGLGSLQEFMEYNRYRRVPDGIVDQHVPAYTPVDGELGFHIRPYRDLLFEIHGGYAYMMNETYLESDVTTGDFGYKYANYQRGKVGGQINYHLQDVVRINLNGDYYFWKGDVTVYDRASWEVDLRIDGRIDKNWSLYSANHFEGNRLALATDGTHILKPIVDLNLGLQYDMWVGQARYTGKTGVRDSNILRPEPKPNLTLFFQLNNWLHRKHDYYYGYRSQGINFLLGATYRF